MITVWTIAGNFPRTVNTALLVGVDARDGTRTAREHVLRLGCSTRSSGRKAPSWSPAALSFRSRAPRTAIASAAGAVRSSAKVDHTSASPRVEESFRRLREFPEEDP